MTKGWSEERRKAQAERCRKNKPWKKATGPKTKEGKARSALNDMKHGRRCRFYDRIRMMLWMNRQFIRFSLEIDQNFDTNKVKEKMRKINKNNQIVKDQTSNALQSEGTL